MIFPQHVWKVVWPESNGNVRRQIGQSSRGGGSLNSSSSCNSATRFSHAFLCFDRCFFLHAALQYLTILHLLHVLRLPPSLPHAAQFVVEVSADDDMVHVFSLCVFEFDADLSISISQSWQRRRNCRPVMIPLYSVLLPGVSGV